MSKKTKPKKLKLMAPVQDEALPAQPVGPPVDPAASRRAAADAGSSLQRRTALINVKVSAHLAAALAQRAQAKGVTQKQVIMHALAAAGLPVDALDLEDRTPRRAA